MFGVARAEPIEEVVFCDIEKKLRAAAVRLPCICHRERSWLVAIFADVLIFDAAPIQSPVRGSSAKVNKGVLWGTTCSSIRGFGILCIWAAKLAHKSRYDSVEVDAIVEAFLA